MPNAPAARPATVYEPVTDRTNTTMPVAAMLSGMRATSAGSSSRSMPRSRRISTKREPSTASGPRGLIDRAAGFTHAQRFIAQTADAVRAAAVGGDPGEQAGRQPLQRCHLAGVQHPGQLLDCLQPAGEADRA